MHPKTRGLDCHTDLTDPHTTTTNAAKIPPCNRATMVVDREVVGEEVLVEGTLPMEGVTRTVGLTRIQE